MNITIKATNVNVNRAMRDHIEKKVSTLQKFIIGKHPVVYVEIGKDGSHQNGNIYHAEITVRGIGKELFARAEKSDVYVAIDTMQEEIVREIKTLKTKQHKLWKRGAIKLKEMMKGMTDYTFRKKSS